MIYFISYDISDTKRLQKVAKILKNFGIRIQYSFFECEIQKEQFEFLKTELLKVINKKEDNLIIYPICENCVSNISSIGNGNIFIPEKFQIL